MVSIKFHWKNILKKIESIYKLIEAGISAYAGFTSLRGLSREET